MGNGRATVSPPCLLPFKILGTHAHVPGLFLKLLGYVGLLTGIWAVWDPGALATSPQADPSMF